MVCFHTGHDLVVGLNYNVPMSVLNQCPFRILSRHKTVMGRSNVIHHEGVVLLTSVANSDLDKG